MSAVMKEPDRAFIHAHFCDRLRRARTARGLTQLALARMVGVNDEQVTAWERGRCLPRTHLLIDLVLALDVDVEWLLFGAAERGPRLT